MNFALKQALKCKSFKGLISNARLVSDDLFHSACRARGLAAQICTLQQMKHEETVE